MPLGTPSGQGVYLTVYPSSRPNTDTVPGGCRGQHQTRIQYCTMQLGAVYGYCDWRVNRIIPVDSLCSALSGEFVVQSVIVVSEESTVQYLESVQYLGTVQYLYSSRKVYSTWKVRLWT